MSPRISIYVTAQRQKVPGYRRIMGQKDEVETILPTLAAGIVFGRVH